MRIVAPALRQRFGAEWRPSEIDLVFVHYLYGLVHDAWPLGSASGQLALLRDLGREVLDPDAIDCALHALPPAAGTVDARGARLAHTLAAAEAFGRRDALAARLPEPDEPDRPIEPNSNLTTIRPAI
ncbi:hypothetical protein NS319_02605 [Sphingomonas sanguinis]|uniref:Uncharacterized protein n=1 Tax=Sphingomonas sanguinis TaxID=33051 RepID=A0A147I5I4_9SPHN|nr:hypothetical protein NS319_02605 [Sphingomonas sanguinis]